MAVIGPVLAVNSERVGGLLFKKKRVINPERERMNEEAIALVEAATVGLESEEPVADVEGAVDRLVEQAMMQSDDDAPPGRRRDPEY